MVSMVNRSNSLVLQRFGSAPEKTDKKVDLSVATTTVPVKTPSITYFPVTRSPKWVNTALSVANYLDTELVPAMITPALRLFNKGLTREKVANELRGNPYSLSNTLFRVKYPRVLGVHVYGSARPSMNNALKHHYELGMKTGAALVQSGLFPVTGGGPGVMEAVAVGANAVNGHSVGISVPKLAQENDEGMPSEAYKELVNSPSFTHRLKGPGGFYHRAGRILVLPGGLGTVRELLEAYEELGYGDDLSHFPLQKQVVVLDEKGYFTRTLKPFLDKLIEEKVASASIYKKIRLVSTLDEAVNALNDPTVPWTNGLKNHHERNLKYKIFSLSSLAEKCFHALHLDEIKSQTKKAKALV